MIVERKNSLKKNKIGHLKIKSYKFEKVENLKYLGVIHNDDNSNQIDNDDNNNQIDNDDNNNQIDLQERIKNANKTYFMLQKFFKNKDI
jgi:hypothetical protein